MVIITLEALAGNPTGVVTNITYPKGVVYVSSDPSTGTVHTVGGVAGAQWRVPTLTEGDPEELHLNVLITDETDFEDGTQTITARTLIAPGEEEIVNNYTIKLLPDVD